MSGDLAADLVAQVDALWGTTIADELRQLRAEVERLRAALDAKYGRAEQVERLRDERRTERAEAERLRAAGDALAACVNQFGDTDNWTHDDGFLFHDEALAAIAAWQEARRG